MADWYYGKNGQQHGPVDIATLKHLAATAQLDPTDLIWHEGMAEWTEASQVKELFPETAGAEGLVGLAPLPVPVMPAIPLSYSQAYPVTEVAYVGFWMRALGAIIDGLIVLGAILIIGLLLGVVLAFTNSTTMNLDSPEVDGLFRLITLLIAWLYYASMESSSKQATLGKLAIGAKVIDSRGERLSFGWASGRYFSKILSSIFMIGYIMVAFNKQKQGLHDLIANTFVVYRRPQGQQPPYSPQQAYANWGA